MYRESLQNNREQILLSKRLATIDYDVPVEFDLEALAAHEPDSRSLKKIYKELEFIQLAEASSGRPKTPHARLRALRLGRSAAV